jgi:hypothetical protein
MQYTVVVAVAVVASIFLYPPMILYVLRYMAQLLTRNAIS